MDRRALVALAAAALATPRLLFAQQSGRVFRIAILDDALESAHLEPWKLFRNRLKDVGLTEDKNAVYIARFAGGASERLPALAGDLVDQKPDIIVSAGTSASIAARRATTSIPIVFIGPGDPVGTGLVASLAHPGGNATGTSNIGLEIGGKQIELLRELFPGVNRLAYLTDAANKGSVAVFHQTEAQARAMNAKIQMFDGRTPTELERSFEAIQREGIQGLIVGTAALLLEHRDEIVQFTARAKLPVVFGRREYVIAGGLLSYSADLDWMYVRAAEYVERILHGAIPASIPVERASTFRMVLNLKTAKAIGVTVPQSILLRADEVIQ